MPNSGDASTPAAARFGKLAEPLALFATGVALSAALMHWLIHGEISVAFIGAALFFFALSMWRTKPSTPGPS
ncbi:MAG: hypothetical protein ABJC33_04345 [Betaproteobacteria bacterium]